MKLKDASILASDATVLVGWSTTDIADKKAREVITLVRLELLDVLEELLVTYTLDEAIDILKKQILAADK